MNLETNSATSPEVEQFFENLNQFWLARDYTSLARCYHPDVVLLPPDAGTPLLGRDAVIATYRDFHELCSVEQFAVTELHSWRFAEGNPDATIMVHMRFAIDYRFTDQAAEGTATTGKPVHELHSEQGLDVYTLRQGPCEESPQIVWRAQFTL